MNLHLFCFSMCRVTLSESFSGCNLFFKFLIKSYSQALVLFSSSGIKSSSLITFYMALATQSEDINYPNFIKDYLNFFARKFQNKCNCKDVMQCILTFFVLTDFFSACSTGLKISQRKTNVKKIKGFKNWHNMVQCNNWFRSTIPDKIVWEITVVNCSKYGGVEFGFLSTENDRSNVLDYAYNISGVTKINGVNPNYECRKNFIKNETIKCILDLKNAEIYVGQKQENKVYKAFHGIKISNGIMYKFCVSLFEVGYEVRLNACYAQKRMPKEIVGYKE